MLKQIALISLFKKILFILIPVLISPLLFLLFSILNMIQPMFFGLSILDWTRFTIYAFLPVVGIFLIGLIFKFKITLDLKTTLFCVIIGFLYLILIFLRLRNFLLPSLTMMGLGDIRPALEYWMLFRDTILIGCTYLSFVVGLFVSQFFENKILKVLSFFLVGIGLSILMFAPLIGILFKM